METAIDYHKLQLAIDDTLSHFQEQFDVNQLIIDLRTILFASIEELIVTAVQKLLYDPCFLQTVKQLAAKLGLRFKGFKPTSIRLLSGQSPPIDSPYFAKARPKSRRGRKSKKRKVAVIWGLPIWASSIVAAPFWHQRPCRQACCARLLRSPIAPCLLLALK